MSIGYANIYSSVQNHRQNFSMSYLSIGSGRTNESNGINKKEAWSSEDKKLWRQEVHKKLTSSETLSSSEASSPEADVIRSSEEHQKLIDQSFSKSCSNDDLITSIIAED